MGGDRLNAIISCCHWCAFAPPRTRACAQRHLCCDEVGHDREYRRCA